MAEHPRFAGRTRRRAGRSVVGAAMPEKAYPHGRALAAIQASIRLVLRALDRRQMQEWAGD